MTILPVFSSCHCVCVAGLGQSHASPKSAQSDARNNELISVKVNEEMLEDNLQKKSTRKLLQVQHLLRRGSVQEYSQLLYGHVNLASLYSLPRLSDSPPARPAGSCPGPPACPAGQPPHKGLGSVQH